MAIHWERTFISALQRARVEDKPIFVDFWSPASAGCRQMETVTYPHGGVERRLNERFVCYRPQIDLNKDVAARFLVQWTPGLLFIDDEENVHYRATGFHPPEEMEHLLEIGSGMIALNQGRHLDAAAAFSRAGNDAQETPLQAEALYWLGVAKHRSGDKEGELPAWNRLLDRHPHSIWALRVSFLRAPVEARH